MERKREELRGSSQSEAAIEVWDDFLEFSFLSGFDFFISFA